MILNVTLSAEATVVRQARRKAGAERTSLNALFQRFLRDYLSQTGASGNYTELMDRFRSVEAGRKFGRDEANARH